MTPECTPEQPCVICWDQVIDAIDEPAEEISEAILFNRRRARDWQLAHPEQAAASKLAWAQSNGNNILASVKGDMG